jgi:uncharacterized membrane protein YkvA (DUF1232 family)
MRVGNGSAAAETAMTGFSSEGLRGPLSKAEMEAIRRAARDEEGVKRDFWQVLRKVGSRIPFSEDVLAAFYCATDRGTERRVKLILMGAVAYFVMPVDIIPDILPMVGFTDDAAVLATALAAVTSAMKPEHRRRAKAALADEPQDGQRP